MLYFNISHFHQLMSDRSSNEIKNSHKSSVHLMKRRIYIHTNVKKLKTDESKYNVHKRL